MNQTRLHTELSFDSGNLLNTGQVLDHYLIERLISHGGFGQVYQGVDIHTNRKIAIKVESTNATIPLLRNEGICIKHLNENSPPYEGNQNSQFLQLFNQGANHSVRYIVMELCGQNLRELKLQTPKNQFSMSTSLWVLQHMLTAIRQVHALGWLHRDVKPANFCIGLKNPRLLYLLDFGMCRYTIASDGSPKPRKPHAAFHGTIRYASINTHNLQDMCRWDDLWSLFYITVENMVGSLPWRSITDKVQVLKMKNNADLVNIHYVSESHAPACVVALHRVLERSKQDSSSFYTTPSYSDLLSHVENDIRIRGTQHHTLDWEQQFTKPSLAGGDTAVIPRCTPLQELRAVANAGHVAASRAEAAGQVAASRAEALFSQHIHSLGTRSAYFAF